MNTMALRNSSFSRRMDSNWVVQQAVDARARLQAIRMRDIDLIEDRVQRIQARILMLVELSRMDYNALTAALRDQSS